MVHPHVLDDNNSLNATTSSPRSTSSSTALPENSSNLSSVNNTNKDGNRPDDDNDDARTTSSKDEERIHDFAFPFLVRTKTNQEKEQMRSEYHQQQQQQQQQDQQQNQQQQQQQSSTTNATAESVRRKSRAFGWVRHWYKKLSTSILLENKASVARDHLANERTFLAWLRTSLSLITVGVAITQLYHLNPSSSDKIVVGRALGATFVALSIVFLYFANARYFHAQYALTQGQFPASRGAVLLGSICVLSVLLAMFIVIVTERP